MSNIYIIVIGIVLTLIVALLGLLNLSSLDKRVSAKVINIENIDGSVFRNITIEYTFQGKNLTTIYQNSNSVNVGDNIDIYVGITGNNDLTYGLAQRKGEFYKIFIPLSYLLLLGTSYYIFKK